jgi:cytochrome P450
MEWRTEHLYAVVGLIILLVGYKLATRDSRRKHLPPHVRGWPIINQTLIQSGDNPTPYVLKWARQYGEIFRTTSVTQQFVWINSRKAFKELIDRKSSIYASKHPQPFGFEIASNARRILFMPYGKEWRAMRTIIHQLFTPQMSRSYAPIQFYEAKQLSVDLLEKPRDFYMHHRRYAASVIMQIIYGRRIPECIPLYIST